MTNNQKEYLKIFVGNSNPELAKEIIDLLSIDVGKAKIKKFSDGEIGFIIDESVRGCDVYIVQSTCAPANDNLMELLIMIDALRRASAKRITVVVPYYGYARQDRKSRGREPITAKLVANLLTCAGADAVLTMDLHTTQIQGFFDIPVDNLSASSVLADYFKHKDVEKLVVASPDMGGVARARNLAEQIGTPLAIVDKRRTKPNVSEVMNVIGDIKGKEVILVDDMIDTAGTITHAAQALIDRGAKCVNACCTHGILSGPAIDRIAQSPIQELVITNTIPLGEKRCDKIKLLSVASVLGNAILRMYLERGE